MTPRTPFTAAAAIAGLIAIGVLANYGTLSPCQIFNQEARNLVDEIVSRKIHQHGLDDGSKMSIIGQALILGIVRALPIEAMLKRRMIQEYGGHGPLQCTAALMFGDWYGVKVLLRASWPADDPPRHTQLPGRRPGAVASTGERPFQRWRLPLKTRT